MRRSATSKIKVVDLFAGPGGLGEGFSSFRDPSGAHPFKISLSVEKDTWAVRTLQFRSFFRQFHGDAPHEYYEFIQGRISEPDWKALYPLEWQSACTEVLQLELGSAGSGKIMNGRLTPIGRDRACASVVIGGPPCQAYSLVGRARNAGIAGYDARDDGRHFLYRQYIDVLRKVAPDAFVMENVKGMLSATIDSKRIFDKVLKDLERSCGPCSYQLFAIAHGSDGRMTLTKPRDHRSFIVRAEDFGIPQARHRVFIVGIRSDIARHFSQQDASPLERGILQRTTLREAFAGLPALRSGLNRADDSQRWYAEISKALSRIIALHGRKPADQNLLKRAYEVRTMIERGVAALDRDGGKVRAVQRRNSDLLKWLVDPKLAIALNHNTRTHMTSDLERYLFATLFAEVNERSPKASDFPKELSPKHRNWKSGKFADRFRVQLYDAPSATVTSHISKDGHYYIHPDPLQCRSLTVREAARLQTFPDNYFFKGGRTDQYVQVGNAVPPFLALQIAEAIYTAIAKRPDERSGKGSERLLREVFLQSSK